MISPMQGIGVAWAVWFTGWLLAAFRTAKTVSHQSDASRFSYVAVLACGAFLVTARPANHGKLQEVVFPPPIPFPWIGLSLVVAGLGFTVWARIHLGRFWSGSITLKEGHSLVRSGPYGVARHPIYTGLVVAVAGTAL